MRLVSWLGSKIKMFVDKILDALKDDKNSIDKLVEIFEAVKLVPQILEKQDQIIVLLKQQGGMSPDFRALLLRDIENLNKLGESNTSKGKEETKQ